MVSAICTAATMVGWPVACLGQSDEDDPSRLWYRGFLVSESAKDLEQKGKYLEALNKVNEAKSIYDGLAFRFPEFQPKIVAYKRKVLGEARIRVKDMMRQYGSETRIASPPVSRPAPERPQPPVRVMEDPEFPNIEAPSVARSEPPPSRTGVPIESPVSTPVETYTGPTGSNVLPAWESGRVYTGGRSPSPGQLSTELLDEARRSRERVEWLTRENEKLLRERDNYRSQLERVQEELLVSQQKQAEYRRRIEDLERDAQNRDAASRIASYKQLLDETMAELKDATELNAKLANQLRDARTKIREQAEQIERLDAERENLLGIIEGRGLGSDKLRDLIRRNQELARKLDNAEKLAASMASINRQKDADIAMLKSQIARVQLERDKLVDENAKHQVEIETLHRKLEMLSEGLSEEEKRNLAGVTPEQRAENELLRSMVLKQLRRQAQVKQAKELLLRQLDRLGARSTVLMEVVEDMARGPQLTPEEKALFRAPQFADLLEAALPPGEELQAETLIGPATGNDTELRGQKLKVELSQLDKAARLDFREGRFAEAEAGWLRYLHFRPRSVACLCNLGILKLTLRNYSEAEHFLQKAVAIDKHSGRAYYLLGRTFFLQHRYDEALTHLEQSLDLEPENSRAHNCVGVISGQKGWVTRAERAFEEAVTLDPDFGDAHFNLAVLCSTRDEPDARKAEEHYFRALELGVPRDGAIESFLKKAVSIDIGLR